MHDCPECGLVCDCDGEDTWNDAAAQNCTHYCGDDEEQDYNEDPDPEDDDDVT
jgi:hypothetical protein